MPIMRVIRELLSSILWVNTNLLPENSKSNLQKIPTPAEPVCTCALFSISDHCAQIGSTRAPCTLEGNFPPSFIPSLLKSKAGTLDDVTTILRHNMGYGVFPLLIGLLVWSGVQVRGTVSSLLPSLLKKQSTIIGWLGDYTMALCVLWSFYKLMEI